MCVTDCQEEGLVPVNGAQTHHRLAFTCVPSRVVNLDLNPPARHLPPCCARTELRPSTTSAQEAAEEMLAPGPKQRMQLLSLDGGRARDSSSEDFKRNMDAVERYRRAIVKHHQLSSTDDVDARSVLVHFIDSHGMCAHI